MSKFSDAFEAELPRGVASRYLKEQTLPQARWQSTDSILSSPLLDYSPAQPGGKILLGALGDRLIGIEDDRHLLTIAGSRAGKSVALVGNLLFYSGSIIALDPKAELSHLTAANRAALGQRVHVLDPFGYTDKALAPYRARYNPMKVLQPGSRTFVEDASLIVDAIVVQSADARDPHWDESAANLIEGAILQVATATQFEGRRNLISVRKLLKDTMRISGDGDERSYEIEQDMLGNAAKLQGNPETEDIGDALEGAARDFFEKSEKERDSVLSTARRHTKFLDYRAMREALSGHDFDLADLKRAPEGVSIYLCFPATRANLSNRWLRIFINQLLDAMEREERQPEAPVLVCLDEFPVLGYMRQLEMAAGQIASYGVKLWTVLQDWGQGKALYKERWETFVANAGVMQVFGNSDLATTEYVSRKLGQTAIEVARQNEVSPQSRQAGLDGRSHEVQLQPLMTAEEITRYFSRDDRLKRQLVMWAGSHPMVLQRVEHFDGRGPLAPHIRSVNR